MLQNGDINQILNDSFLKRKDPKKMSMDELEEYIKSNKARIKTEESQSANDNQMYYQNSMLRDSNRDFGDKDKEYYIKELELKVTTLFTQNEELKSNFIQVSELLEKERKEYGNKLQNALNQCELKFFEENQALLKELDELKFKTTIQGTSMSILSSEKERHLEQNAIDKDYYETKIEKLIEENKNMKKEIKDHVKDFSDVIEEQKDLIASDYEEQIKCLKDMLSKQEKEKNYLTKKYDTKLRELTVKINRLERNDHNLSIKSKSKSKGKLCDMISIYRSKSKSKSRGKLTQSSMNSVRDSNRNNKDIFNQSFRLTQNENKNNSNYSNSNCKSNTNSFNMTPIYTGKSLTAINDSIFALERTIADLNRNYTHLNEKIKSVINQEEITLLRNNLSLVKCSLDEQNNKLQELKQQQQDFLWQGYLIDTL